MFRPTAENLPPLIEKAHKDAGFATGQVFQFWRLANAASVQGYPDGGRSLAEEGAKWGKRRMRSLRIADELQEELDARKPTGK